MVFPTSWPASSLTDFVPGTAPAAQELATGVTSTTIDFPPPTGDTVSGTPTVTLRKPTGSAASASIALSGSNWRVSLSSLADGEAYTVEVEFTSTGGQKANQSCFVSVAATTLGTLLYDVDFTKATNQSGLGPDGTYSIVVDGVTYSLVVTHTNANNPTVTADLVNGTGLVISAVSSSATAWNKMYSLSPSAKIGDLKPDSNMLRCVCLMEITTMNQTADQVTFEVGDGLPVSAAYPMLGGGYYKQGANDWRARWIRRNTSSTTGTLGGTLYTTQPTALRAEIYTWGMLARGFVDQGTTWPTSTWSITDAQGFTGQDALTGVAYAPTYWNSTQYACVTLAGSTVETLAVVVKGIRIYSAPPRRL